MTFACQRCGLEFDAEDLSDDHQIEICERCGCEAGAMA